MQHVLTAKQLQTYEFIREYIQNNQIAPTEAEIALGIGIKSRGVVHRYVQAIAAAGLIEIIPKRRRNIRLVDMPDVDSVHWELPIVGKIAAGQPIEAILDDRVLDISQALLGDGRFVLEVKGNSMIGDNICDGDYVICQKQNTADNGKIVVALVDNEEATLKRLRRNNNGTVTLIPSNPTLSPMVYPAERVQVQGVFLGLLRLL